ncbi:hypothetical protein, partial [Stenotrophomonas sp.]|uniref:DUF7507 domain-containing protein n=1 Tax=Stenotrophomonas sp. TaxID=69392 RepID=UPI0028A595AB
MFAEKIVVGFNRVACVGVLAIAGLFAGSVVHAQNATNTATLTPPTGVTNPGTSCTDTDSDVTTTVSFAGNVCTARDQDPITAPKLHITKTVSASPMVVGVAASYTLKVDNTGTAATTAVATVTDTIPTGLTIGTLPPGCAASGQTVTCTIAAGLPATNGTKSFVIPVTPTAAAAASVTNTASVIGGGDANCATSEGEGCTSTVITPVSTPALELTKNAVLAADQSTITYGFSVRNTGGAVLNNVTVSDPKLPGLSCTSIAVLGINATQTFTCTANVYSTVAADFDAGSVVNVATATGTPAGGTTSVSDDSTVTTPLVPSPKLSITKTAGKATYAAVGEVVSYDYVVTNTGNVTINGLSVSDDKIAAVSCPVSTLAPKAATTCTASYTITQADLDVGSVTNVATANGTPTGGTLTPPTDTETVTSTATPKLTSTKVVTSTGPYTVG